MTTTTNVAPIRAAKAEMPDHPVPSYWRILLKPRAPREKVGSILLSDEAKDIEKLWTGVSEVIAVGPGVCRFQETGEPWAESIPPKVGDFVLTDRSAGFKIQYAGQDYIIVEDRDIIATVGDMYAVKGFFSNHTPTYVE